MGSHWRLAVRFAAWTTIFAVFIGAVVWYYYGAVYAAALLYGVFVGLVSFVSTALSVSLITGRTDLLRALGAMSFFLRYGFVAVALGVPAYFGFWPVVAMMAGFVGVYLAENVVLLPGVVRTMSKPTGSKERAVDADDEEVERRVTV